MPFINKYYKHSQIKAYDAIVSSYHRGIFLYIDLQSYLQNTIYDTTDPTSRSLFSHNN